MLSFARPANGPELLTSTAIDGLHPYISEVRAKQPINGLSSAWSYDSPLVIDKTRTRFVVRNQFAGLPTETYVPYYYRQIAQSLMSLIAAGAGAFLALLFPIRTAETQSDA
jgi:hypothetical protein